MSADGGEPTKRFDTGLTIVRWSGDGRSLFYVITENDHSNIWSHPITGGNPEQITHFSNGLIRTFDVSRDGKRLVIDRFSSNSDVVLIREIK